MKTAISILIAGALIGGAIMLASSDGMASTANVSVVDGKQIVEVTAKGRYSPKLTAAKAGMPTILRMKTTGTYDCTAALRVPSLRYEKMLPPSGMTDIELSAQEAGATVQGVCAMGMYSFKVQFN
jgi:Cu+-exporting ATPase